LITFSAIGTSAGSLCTVALSAVVQTQDGMSQHPFTFQDLKDMVFNLTVGSVIDITPYGIYKILTYNVKEGYLLDTTPLRNMLITYLSKMGYKFMKDLYIPTCISAVDSITGLPVRFCSDDPSTQNLLIVDVVMASAAMPVVFPSQQIPGFGNTSFVDGGVGIDMIPTDAAYQRNLDEVYLITRQWELNNAQSLPNALKDIKILSNAITTFNNLLQASFFSGLSTAAAARIPSYSYIPVLSVDFGVLDFDQGKLMYEITRNWTRTNSPICMNCLAN
jgi:predicted acylesterase/phospholipase RssA